MQNNHICNIKRELYNLVPLDEVIDQSQRTDQVRCTCAAEQFQGIEVLLHVLSHKF